MWGYSHQGRDGCRITGGGSNAFNNWAFTLSGFDNAGNNGTFIVGITGKTLMNTKLLWGGSGVSRPRLGLRWPQFGVYFDFDAWCLANSSA
jgi:hypothetical protein